MGSGIFTTIGGSADPLAAELDRVVNKARTAAKEMSTVLNESRPVSAGEKYASWWSSTLQKRDDAELADVTSKNKAHAEAVARGRAENTIAAERATAAGVEQARRDIRARALRRERAAMREEALNKDASQLGAGSIPESWAQRNAYMLKYGKHASAFGGASATMFVSAARDTAASLATGANPITVFMQQAPQVLQGMFMMGMSLKQVFLGVLGPIGLVAAALIGVTAGINKLVSSVYDNGITRMASNVLERQRLWLHELVQKRKEETAELERQLQITREMANSSLSLIAGAGEAASRARIAEAKTPDEAREIERNFLQSKLTIAKMDMEALKPFENSLQNRSKANDFLKAQTAWFNARTELANFENRAAKEELRENKIPEVKSNGTKVNMLTDWERAGASRGSNMMMLDVNKAQLKELQTIRQLMGKKGGGRVSFGG